MKIYLAAGAWKLVTDYNATCILESYYYSSNKLIDTICNLSHFLLDSGAFTFMQNSKITPNWDEYIQRYAAFIVAHDIKLFFELDIDSVVGLTEVERLRDKLETLTNRKCIPVWHKSRGQDYWLKMAEDYDYIAIGGIVSGEITKNQFQYFPTLINLAKERGAKVHGLGFTQLLGLKKYKFYSVDSSTWSHNGHRFGKIYYFSGTSLKNYHPRRQVVSRHKLQLHNFNEWVKFQRYAEVHL